MKRQVLLLACLVAASSGFSQTARSFVIASDGNVSKAAGISLEWTLGELATETTVSGQRMLTQGFHQPLLTAREIDMPRIPLAPELYVKVAPNPVATSLTVTFHADRDEPLYLSLLTIGGMRLHLQSVQSKTGMARVDMSGMLPGLYLLELRQANGRLIRSYKIVKAE